MADKKISDLGDGGLPQNTDDFVVARGTTNNKIAWSSMAAAAASGKVAIGASNTTYTSGTVVFSGSNLTVSTNGQTVVLSAPAQTVQTQNAVDVTLSGNTAGALALVSSGTLTLAGGNNITLSQAGNAITISGANAGGAQTAISGIAVSDATYTSGTVSLVGSGAATVKSGTGQRVIIDVPVQSTQVETQTFVGGISASDTLYTSGSVRFTGVGGGITVGTNTGQRIDLSVAAPVAQTAQTGISGIANSQTTFTSGTVSLSELGAITIRSTTGNQYQFSVNAQSVQPETQTFIGGVSASNTLYTSGSVRFTGSQAVTVRSGTGQLVIIDVPAQTTQVETQTFVGGIGNSQTTYTSGTVNLSVVGGNLTIRSTTGNAFQFSASQSVQAETQTFLGGVVGSNATYTSGTFTITGVGGGVTVSSNTGQRIDISVAAPVAQTGTYQSAIAASNTTYTSGLVVFTGSNMVTVKSSGAGQTVIIDATQTNQSAIKGFGASNTGNTSGNTGVSTGIDWVLAGTNNVTISQSTAVGGPNTLWVSGPTVGGAQTGISGIANSQTTYTSGTVSLSELANITIRSTTGNQFQFSVAGTTGTGNLNAISNSNTTFTSGTIGLSELGAITIRSTTGNQFQFSVNAQSVQPETQTFVGGIGNSQTTYTSGTVNLSVNGGLMTIRSTTGNAFQFSVSQSVQAETQTAISGIANSQTTYTSGTVSLSELGAITIRSTTGNQYQFSVNAQTTQSAIKGFGASNTGNTAGNTGMVTGVDWVLAGSTNITVSQSTAVGGPNTLWLSAPNAGAGGFAGAGISGGNTSGDTGTVASRLVFAGGNNITLSGSTNGGSMTITVSAPNLGAGAMSAGVSNLGNTAGATGITGTQLVMVGTGPISLSQTTGANGGTVSINAPATSSLSATGAVSISVNGSTISIGAPTQTNQAGSLYAVGNSTGTSSGTYDARTLSISGAGIVSVAASNSGLVISASQSTLANIVGSSGISISSNASSLTIYQAPVSFLEHNTAAFYSSSSSAISQNTNASVVRMVVREGATFSRVDIPMWISLATQSSSNTAAHSISKVMILGTRNGSTINAITGTSQTEVFSWASNNANYGSLTGPRLMSFPLAAAITPGEYYIAYYLSTTAYSSVGAANTTNLGGTYGPLFGTQASTATMWANFGSATNATSNPVNFMQGVQSISISATNQTFQATNITQSGTAGARANQILLFRG